MRIIASLALALASLAAAVSGKTAVSLLGAEPYTADRLLMLREDLAKGLQQ